MYDFVLYVMLNKLSHWESLKRQFLTLLHVQAWNAHIKAVNNFKAVNKYININVNGIPYKLTILHYMYQLF